MGTRKLPETELRVTTTPSPKAEVGTNGQTRHVGSCPSEVR